MELFITLAYAVDDLNGFFFVWRRNFHGLEAPFERAIFFNGLTVLGRCRRADTLNFTARQCRLQNIRSVQRTFS